jgi:predicted KAP-like P-loop ATPase
MIDNISAKIMIARNPVIGIFGKFGSGKTSILNLLKEHLNGKAIVVSFTTWLPGSQETLSAYLIADIANECQKHYMVPGMSKSARKLANALSKTVPILKGYSELSPAPTQRDDIESMKNALTRLPKRVVVLLDELDRMEREEILTLLKVIRGISTLPNLSFVCALDIEELIRIVRKDTNPPNSTYFDKFFPVSVPVPEIDDAALQNAGVERLTRAFEQRNWFANEFQKSDFRRLVTGIWKDQISLVCPNLRAIGLLANDAGTAASLLKGEVNPIDLILIEMLHRFFPSVYEIVSRNSLTLTGGEGWLKGGVYHSDEEKKALRQRFLEDLDKAEPAGTRRDFVNRVLGMLFPLYDKVLGASWTRRMAKEEATEDDRHICESSMFPAYFRYELPESVFSSVELEEFILRIKNNSGEEGQLRIFLEELGTLEKGSLKRDDFLRKLSEAGGAAPPAEGRALAQVAMKAADQYSYDSFSAYFGEAGHVLRLVLGVAKKVQRSERTSFLSKCIQEATDDTMAFRNLLKIA